MAYNKTSEERKWNYWKEQEEKKLRELGMEEEKIQKLRQMDREDFLEERRYREHLDETIWMKHSRSVTWSLPNRKILSRCRKRGKRICPAFPCTAEIFLPGRKTGLMEQSQGNRSVPVSAGSWRTSNGRKQRNPRSGAGKRTVDQRKRRRKREINER